MAKPPHGVGFIGRGEPLAHVLLPRPEFGERESFGFFLLLSAWWWYFFNKMVHFFCFFSRLCQNHRWILTDTTDNGLDDGFQMSFHPHCILVVSMFTANAASQSPKLKKKQGKIVIHC